MSKLKSRISVAALALLTATPPVLLGQQRLPTTMPAASVMAGGDEWTRTELQQLLAGPAPLRFTTADVHAPAKFRFQLSLRFPVGDGLREGTDFLVERDGSTVLVLGSDTNGVPFVLATNDLLVRTNPADHAASLMVYPEGYPQVTVAAVASRPKLTLEVGHRTDRDGPAVDLDIESILSMTLTRFRSARSGTGDFQLAAVTDHAVVQVAMRDRAGSESFGVDRLEMNSLTGTSVAIGGFASGKDSDSLTPLTLADVRALGVPLRFHQTPPDNLFLNPSSSADDQAARRAAGRQLMQLARLAQQGSTAVAARDVGHSRERERHQDDLSRRPSSGARNE